MEVSSLGVKDCDCRSLGRCGGVCTQSTPNPPRTFFTYPSDLHRFFSTESSGSSSTTTTAEASNSDEEPWTAPIELTKSIGKYKFGIETDAEVNMPRDVQALLDLERTGSKSELMQARRGVMVRSWQPRPGDTGSSRVQVAALTVRIDNLIEHMKEFKKDHHSKRGLDALVQRRKRLLQYMKRKEHDVYKEVIRALNLAPVPDGKPLRLMS